MLRSFGHGAVALALGRLDGGEAHVGVFLGHAGFDELDPLVLVRVGEGGGDDGVAAGAAGEARALVGEGGADALGGGLVDEEAAGVGLGIGVHETTLMPRSWALRRTEESASGLAAGGGDGVNPARDPGLDDLGLFGRIGIGGGVPERSTPSSAAAASAPCLQETK